MLSICSLVSLVSFFMMMTWWRHDDDMPTFPIQGRVSLHSARLGSCFPIFFKSHIISRIYQLQLKNINHCKIAFRWEKNIDSPLNYATILQNILLKWSTTQHPPSLRLDFFQFTRMFEIHRGSKKDDCFVVDFTTCNFASVIFSQNACAKIKPMVSRRMRNAMFHLTSLIFFVFRNLTLDKYEQQVKHSLATSCWSGFQSKTIHKYLEIYTNEHLYRMWMPSGYQVIILLTNVAISHPDMFLHVLSWLYLHVKITMTYSSMAW